MKENFATDYMKNKEKENLFKGIVSILIGFMLVLLAIFTVVSYYSFFISHILVIIGIICFIAGICAIRRNNCG